MCPALFSPVKSRFVYLTATSNLHLDVDGPQQSSPSSPSNLSSLSSPSQLLTAPSSHFLKPNTLETPLTHLFLSHPHPICQQILLVPPSKYTPNPSPPFFTSTATTQVSSIGTSHLDPCSRLLSASALAVTNCSPPRHQRAPVKT